MDWAQPTITIGYLLVAYKVHALKIPHDKVDLFPMDWGKFEGWANERNQWLDSIGFDVEGHQFTDGEVGRNQAELVPVTVGFIHKVGLGVEKGTDGSAKLQLQIWRSIRAKMGLYLIGIADGDLPNSAFTKIMQGKAKRVGVDLPKLHKALKDVQKISSKTPKDRAEFIIQRLFDEDISLKKGDKEGVLILYKYDEKSQRDVEFGSLQRLTKLTKENILEIYPYIKIREENYEQGSRRKTSNDRGYSQSNIIYHGRSKPANRGSNPLGGDSRKATRDTKTTDFGYRQNPRHSLSHKQAKKLSGFMINLKGITRRRFPKGIAASLSHSTPSSGAGPAITDVFNDGAAALRAATNSIGHPGF